MTFKKGSSGNPAGRTRRVLTVKEYATVERLSALGSHEVTMAARIGMDEATWHRRKKVDRKLVDALMRGRAKNHDFLVRSLMTSADKGYAPSAMFLLKARHGYRENDSPADAHPRVIINLPGPVRSIEEFRAPVPVERDDKPALPEADVERTTG